MQMLRGSAQLYPLLLARWIDGRSDRQRCKLGYNRCLQKQSRCRASAVENWRSSNQIFNQGDGLFVGEALTFMLSFPAS
jgi:hypothetical protein